MNLQRFVDDLNHCSVDDLIKLRNECADNFRAPESRQSDRPVWRDLYKLIHNEIKRYA